jgi:hypothetical protein
VTFITDAYEARDGFIQAKEAHRLGVELHRSADVAIKVVRNLKTKLSDFITYSLSVHNTLNGTLDWLYWARVKTVLHRKIFLGFCKIFRIGFWVRICRTEWGFVEFAGLRLEFSGIWRIQGGTVKMNLGCNFLEQAFACFLVWHFG